MIDSNVVAEVANEPNMTTPAAVKPNEIAALEKAAEEITAEAVVPEKKDDDRFAPKFAALSKKEKEIKRQQAELKQRLQDLEQRESKYKEFEAKRAKAKIDPVSYMKEADLSYDDLTQYYLNGQKPSTDPKVSDLELKIQTIEKMLREKIEKEQESAQQTAVKTFEGKIDAVLKGNIDKFELTNAFGGPETVYNLIDQHYQQTGSVMEIEEACELAEAYFEKQAEEQVSKMFQVKKLSGKLGPQKEPQAAEAKPSAIEKKPTLSNELSQNISRSDRPLTDRERLKQAAELIKFI